MKHYIIVVIFAMTTLILRASPKLLIKIPTRSRPNKFFMILDCYYQKISKVIPYHFLISLDIDDATMNNVEVIYRLLRYQNLSFSFDNNKTKIEAYNRDIEKFDFDILLVASDDAEPVVDDYDLIIAQEMHKNFPLYDGVLHFNDGFVHSQCNTLPVIGKKFYERFGYVYHPSYKSLWCDVEFTVVSRLLKKERLCDEIIIRHNHPTSLNMPLDDLYIKNDLFNEEDERNIYQRRKNKFDLSQNEISSFYTKVWSILLCSENDPEALVALKRKLEKQVFKLNLEDSIEILMDKSARNIGYKQNVLLSSSSGRFVNFISDKMEVSEDYIEVVYSAIKEAIQHNFDCVRFVGVLKANNRKVIQSIHEDRDFLPSYFQVIRSDIMTLFVFHELCNTEQMFRYELNKSGLLKTEVNLDKSYCFFL